MRMLLNTPLRRFVLVLLIYLAIASFIYTIDELFYNAAAFCLGYILATLILEWRQK